MVEQFLEPGVSLEAIAATHKALVESGAPIAAINAVRKHLSAVKGGRLAEAAAPAEQMTIFVSDVPEGSWMRFRQGRRCRTAARWTMFTGLRRSMVSVDRLPHVIAEMLTDAVSLSETPKAGDAIFARSRWSVLLDSVSLEEAAAVRARELGWHVEIDNRCDDWSAEQAAEYLLERLRELRRVRERGFVCCRPAR